jgi:hypothetical protein
MDKDRQNDGQEDVRRDDQVVKDDRVKGHTATTGTIPRLPVDPQELATGRKVHPSARRATQIGSSKRRESLLVATGLADAGRATRIWHTIRHHDGGGTQGGQKH